MENIHLLRIIIICVTAAIEVLLGILVVVSIRKDKKKKRMMSGYNPMEAPMQGENPVQSPPMHANMGDEQASQPQMDATGMRYQSISSPQNAHASMPQPEMPYPVNPQGGYTSISQPESAKSWYIEGISGFFNGQRMEINGAISLGRNAEQCQTAYPVDYKGISGKHCELAVTPQGVYLKDCGSSYGTFTEEQGKLSAEQPVPLRDGQTFYLANPNEMFRLIRM